MALLDTMIQTYGYNEPILIGEIHPEPYSRPWLYKELNRLCGERSIVRFDKGIYYIPKQTPLGLSMLNPIKAIEKKYVRTADRVFGYYSGRFFMNRIGLSNQMPNIIEVYTNHESANMRDVTVGTQKVRLRKARTEITKENCAVQCFLELMNGIDAAAVDENMRRIIQGYLIDKAITRSDVARYARFFPDKAMRALIESGVIYAIAP